VRTARRPLFTRDMFKLPPRDPLFKLAPREERVSAVRSTREARRPLFSRDMFKSWRDRGHR
jgi:hypothetical protein